MNGKFESEASESAERELQSSIIQGTSTKWRIYNLGQKVWKAFKFESSRRVIIVHLHIAVVQILRKTLIAMWHSRYAKITLDKNSFSAPLLWLPWHFELNVWSWLLASVRVRDKKYLGVGFIFRISESTSMVFRDWQRTGLTSVQLGQNTQLLEGCLARTETSKTGSSSLAV